MLVSRGREEDGGVRDKDYVLGCMLKVDMYSMYRYYGKSNWGGRLRTRDFKFTHLNEFKQLLIATVR